MDGLVVEIKAKFVDDALEELYQELLPGYKELIIEGDSVMLRRGRTVVFLSRNEALAPILLAESARHHDEELESLKEALEAERLTRVVDAVNHEVSKVNSYYRQWYMPAAFRSKRAIRGLLQGAARAAS